MTEEIIYSEMAERAVLAVLLMDGNLVKTVDLKPNEFFIRRYAVIYNTIQLLIKRGKPVDILTVSESMKSRGLLDDVGGFSALSSLLIDPVVYTSLPEYAEMIRDKANRRAAIQLCGEIAAAAGDPSKEYNAGEFANRILQTQQQATNTVHISQALSGFLDWQLSRVEMRERGELGLLATTHIPELDDILVYLEAGQETIIAGEPGVGKTMLVQQIVETNTNTKSIIFSMEMKATRLTARLVSSRCGVPVSQMRMGLPTNTEAWQQKIYEAVADLEVAGIYINDRPGITVEGMYSETARLLASGHEIGLCAIDYFGLIQDGGGADNQTEREGVVSAKLQRMFRELSVHGLVIDTYNKAGFNGTSGRMGNITGAARKTYDADNVLTLTLGDIVPQVGTLVHADIVKVRDGEISKGRVSLMREIGKPRYRSLNENERNNLPIA